MSINDVIGEPVEMPADETQAQPAEQEQTQEQAQEQPQEQQHEEKLVPLPALHEERQRRRELQARLQESERRNAEIEARMQARLEQLQAALQPKQEIPSVEENPVGHLKHSLDEVRALAQQTNGQLTQWQQRQAQEAQIQAAAARVTAAESEFSAQKPDYNDALNYYRSQRARELVVMNGLDEDSAQMQVGRELMEGAILHAANGRNPAEIAYRLAETRGYKPKTVSDAQKIETQQRGVAASKTLGSGGAAGGLSAKALLEMSDEDFSKATKGNKWRELMGG